MTHVWEPVVRAGGIGLFGDLGHAGSVTTSTFPDWFFERDDPSPDPVFYRSPRLVTHIDDAAIAAVGQLYSDLEIDGSSGRGRRVLDLMSSWVSHLRTAPDELVVLGLNERELAANPMATQRLVQDLNIDPKLPFPDASMDAVLCCVSIDYLTRPVEVLTEAARVLRDDAPLAITFSNRCFPTKAVHGWLATDDLGRGAVIARLISLAGNMTDAEFTRRTPPGAAEGGSYLGDPLYAVLARRRPR